MVVGMSVIVVDVDGFDPLTRQPNNLGEIPTAKVHVPNVEEDAYRQRYVIQELQEPIQRTRRGIGEVLDKKLNRAARRELIKLPDRSRRK